MSTCVSKTYFCILEQRILSAIYGPSTCIKGLICDKDVLSSDIINAVEILMTTDVYDILAFRCIH
jgi:hypothetical protein